jgi:hypothetical protein
VYLLSALAMTLLPTAALAATKYWDPSSGNNWNTAANWNPSGVPGTDDNAVFDSGYSTGNCTINTNVNVKGISINAEELYQSFLSDEKAANTAYLEKAIEISGKIGSISKNADSSQVLFLQTSDPIFGVNCTMEGKAENLKSGDSIRLKGICSGFIIDVVLIRCHIVE